MVSMGTVWDRATEFLSDNLASIFPLALFAIFLPLAISQSIQPLIALGGSTALLALLLWVCLSIASKWGSIAIMALALDAAGGRKAAITTANRRFLPIIGISLLLLIGFFALLLPPAIAVGLSGLDAQAAVRSGKMELGDGLSSFVTLYLVFLLGAFVWLAARLLLLAPTILVERRGIGAITRSFKLTRPVQWKIIGVAILFVIVMMVSVLAANFVFGSIFRLIFGGDAPVTPASVLTSTLVSVVLTAFSVLAAAFTAKLYLAVRDARGAIVESA